MVFWLACNLFLQNTVFIHDYFMYYGAVPFFALAAVEGIRTLASWLPLRRWLSLSVVSAVALYFFIPQAVTSLHTFHMREPAHVEEVVVGSALNSLTEPDQVLLFSSAPPYPRMRYYIDRQFKVVTDIEGLQRELAKTPAPPLYVLDARTQVPPELRRYLFEHFRVEQMGSYSVFDLTAQPGNTFQPAREASATPVVRFDAPLELLSAELSPTVVTSAPQASWWHRYLNAHPELLPENQTRVTVTYVWRASGRVGQDYSVVTRLIHVLTGEAAVEVRQQPFSGNLPTSLWQPGEVIRDEFELVLPARATPGRYRLEVALLDAGEKRISSSETPSSMYPTLLVMPRKPDPPVAGMAPGCESLSEPLRPSPLTVAGWCRNPGWIDIYWRIASPTSENYFGTLLFTSEDLALERNVGLLLASTWQPGALYRTRVPLASGLIPSQYQVELLVTGEVDPDHPQALPLGAYRVDGEVFPAIVRVGQPDLCSKECSRIDPNSPLNVRYSLPAQRAVDVVIAWAGRFQLPKMRVQVWLDNDVWVWKPKLLCTLVVGGDQPSQTAVRIPKRLTVPGENRVVIGVAKPGEAYLGWRWLAVTLIPNLKHFIKDSYQPYSGWADVDFVDVRLATEPTSREELLEVADLYESQGLYSVALDFLERAMALHPEQATLADRLREARLRLGTGATDEAAALYHEVLMLVGQGETLSPPECEILIEALYNLASLTHEPELRLAYQAALETVVPNYDPQLLGGAVLYLGHELSLRGRDAIVRLYFVPISTPSLDYTVWLHAKPDNVEVLPEGRKQHGFLNLDHLPLQPTSRWKPHRLYVDEHRFEVGAACYDVDFGLWHGQSGSRLLTESGNHGLFLGRLCAYEPAVASTPRAQAAAEQLTLGQVLRLLSMHAQARQHYSRVVQLLNLEESLNQDERRILIQALLDLTSMSLHPDITRAYEAVLADVVPGYEPVTLGGVVRYLGHEAVVADGEIIIRLYLVPLMHIDGDYVIWMHASPDNKEVLPEERKQYGFLNLDRRPTPATSLWRPHQLYVDERQFTLEKACYSVRFGFWRPENGSRLLLPDGQQGISLGEICVGQERISLSTAVD
jgi:tetratricopeptide (TPR) repeat protein